jgi:hypothetical protein
VGGLRGDVDGRGRGSFSGLFGDGARAERDRRMDARWLDASAERDRQMDASDRRLDA